MITPGSSKWLWIGLGAVVTATFIIMLIIEQMAEL